MLDEVRQMGQMVMTGIEGLTLSPEEAQFLKKKNIGAVILFSKNYESPAQLAELVNSIQKLRWDYPLFIAVDHEGGRVIRFKKDFTQFPSMLDLALLDSPKMCFEVARIMAQELSACGINLNMAPCCDVLIDQKDENRDHVIGDRAFGRDGETVAKFISATIRGFQTTGILACAKHFPGHGLTGEDSHRTLPIITASFDEWEAQALGPFIKAIRSGVEVIMMGHLLAESIDPDYACSLSSKAHQLLRKDYKFNRLIISDDMQMGAIADHYTVEEAAALALRAGSDIIEYRDVSQAECAFEGLTKAIVDKKIKSAALEAKYNRIFNCKKKYFANYHPLYIPEVGSKVGTSPSRIFLEDLKKKISSLKNV